MRVRVLFFGRLRELTGCAEDWAEMPAGASVESLFAHYAGREQRLQQHRANLAAAVNEELAGWNTTLEDGDEVAFLPPVSGGAAESPVEVAADIVQIIHESIRAAELIAAVKRAGDGAVVVFDGIVRDNTKGRGTLYLDYEAYEPMALRKMREIVAEMRARFAIDRIALVHRLGRLEIGETSVLIAVSAAHRAAAFDAARFAIETLKKSVPIWKKEYFADGEVWVEGATAEPVPHAANKPFSTRDES